MQDQKPFLKTKNLDIGYAEKAVAENLDLRFQKGRLHAIIGINGIGKSTLLQTLSGQLEKLSGEIELKNQELNKFSPSDSAREIGVVFTHRDFSQNLTVYDFVALGRHPYTGFLGKLSNEDKREVKDALEILEIHHFSSRKCVNLSDGQLQKVLIARVLAQNTSVILMDEPTHHLDFYNRAFVMRLLKKLTRDYNKCILFSTHEINMALKLSDDIVLLQKSGCVQNTPAELISSQILENIFPKGQVQFNRKEGVFKIKEL
jgi:iron complex transport system ATP-binding protein